MPFQSWQHSLFGEEQENIGFMGDEDATPLLGGSNSCCQHQIILKWEIIYKIQYNIVSFSFFLLHLISWHGMVIHILLAIIKGHSLLLQSSAEERPFPVLQYCLLHCMQISTPPHFSYPNPICKRKPASLLIIPFAGQSLHSLLSLAVSSKSHISRQKPDLHEISFQCSLWASPIFLYSHNSSSPVFYPSKDYSF